MNPPQPNQYSFARNETAVGPNLPTPKRTAIANRWTASAPNLHAPIDLSLAIRITVRALNPPAPRNIALANRDPAPVFNFPHAQLEPGSHCARGVGDSSPLQPNCSSLAKHTTAAAFNFRTAQFVFVSQPEDGGAGLNHAEESSCLTTA